MNKGVFDGFTVKIFFGEDNYYLAHFVELPNVWAFGTNPSEALIELEATWELIKQHSRMDSEPIPQAPSPEAYEGSFNVPVDTQLYHALTVAATEAGVNLYTLVARKLAAATNTDIDGSGEA